MTPYLPEPTGPCPVGTTSLWLTDTSRPDPWAVGVSARELMVSVRYPAAPSDGRRAQYMTPAESELQLTSRGIAGVPPDTLSTVRTNAVSDATPAGRQHALPLVVLSPGFTNSRSALTALAEDLSSHGYVVAGIDHTYESFATAFPDGRVTTCLARETRRRSEGFWEKAAAGRAADVSFVLNELTGAHPAWPGAGLIDPSRIAMAGGDSDPDVASVLRRPTPIGVRGSPDGAGGQEVVADRGPLQGVADAVGDVVARLPGQQACRAVGAGVGAGRVAWPPSGLARSGSGGPRRG